MIKKFKLFCEELKDEWYENHPDFYISTRMSGIKSKITDEQEIDINNLTIDDIEFIDVESTEYFKGFKIIVNNIEIGSITDYIKGDVNISLFLKNINLSLLVIEKALKTYNELKITAYNNKYLDVNKIIKLCNKKYKIITQDYDMRIYQTDDKNTYLKYVNELKKYTIKYYTTIKGDKDYFDYKGNKISQIRSKLKNIKIEDIKVEIKNDVVQFSINNQEINKNLIKFKLIKIFSKSNMPFDNLFGLGNRFHNDGIDIKLRGIGFGYKLYKALIKHCGYITSNESTSKSAIKIYYKLLNDKDIYHIKNLSDNSVLLIWNENKDKNKIINKAKKYAKENNMKLDFTQ